MRSWSVTDPKTGSLQLVRLVVATAFGGLLACGGRIIDTGDGGVEPEGGSAQIDCPTSPCAGDEICCVSFAGGPSIACTSACATSGVLACLHPSDCGGQTPTCCATAVIDDTGGGAFPACIQSGIQSVSTTCTATTGCLESLGLSCQATDVLRLCSTSADCLDSPYPSCCELSVGSSPLSVCLPSVAATFLTCN